MEHSEQLNELAAALAKAQAKIRGAAKDSINPHFKNKYADLGSVWDACRGPLTEHGLAVVQLPGFENGVVTLDTVLLHSSGQWLSGRAGAPIGKQDAQGVGSALTYLRRYALAAVASVSPEDDDGNAARSGRGVTAGRGPKEPPASPPTPTAPTPAELNEKPAALRGTDPMPWEGPEPLKWKSRALTEFTSEELLTLRSFCQRKDAQKYEAYLSGIETILESRRGE